MGQPDAGWSLLEPPELRYTAHMSSDFPPDLRDKPFLIETLAVYGVGLLGGSVALAAKSKKVARQVIGVGRRADRLQAAVRAGVIDEICTDFSTLPPSTGLLVLAAPVNAIAQVVRNAIPHLPACCVITDVGSTKVELAESLRDLTGDNGTLPFVGSHPIAGGDKAGFEYSTSDLFEHRTCVICPGGARREAVIQVDEFWRALGMKTVEMTALDHDEALATTSHLPHVAASALAGVLPEAWQPLTGTGFRDTSRVAMGPSDLWVSILESNRGPVIRSLKALQSQLGAYIEALESHDPKRLFELLHTAEEIRKQLETD